MQGRLSLCLPGWSAMAQSWLTATLPPRFKRFSCPSFPNREIPGRGATRVASATLLAGAALPDAEYTGRTGSAGPIPTRRTAIGSSED
ncbi:hypothetical protein AAY473_012431 [Plecturocebus cupreus]